MRQVFTSQRMETAEGVAKLLRDAGIEIHFSNPRSYRSKRSGQFSYTEPAHASEQPTVWVRHAEDQPRAREILREAGLLESTRPGQRQTLTFATPAEETTGSRRGNWAWRLRLVLLAIIALAALLTVLRHRQAPAPVPAMPATTTPVAAPATAPAQDEEEESVRVQVKPAAD